MKTFLKSLGFVLALTTSSVAAPINQGPIYIYQPLGGSSGGGGTGCVPTGSANNILVDSGAGACGSDTATSLSSGALSLGSSGILGSVTFGNATSGTLTLEPVTGALGAVTVLLPDISDTLVSLTATQTLTNKTIDASSNTISIACNQLTDGATGCSNAIGTSGATIPLWNATGKISGPWTFTNSDLLLQGSSTGKTTFTSDNAGASNFTLHVPAANDTISTLAATQTLTNKTINASLNTLSNIPNSALTNSSTTVNGQTCTLGSSCNVTAAASEVTIGSTTISSGTTKGLLYDNAGLLGNLATANSGLLVTDSSGVPSIGTAIPNGVTATTQSFADNSTKVATTAFVHNVLTGPVWQLTLSANNNINTPGTLQQIPFDTSQVDTSSSCDLVTNKGRCTPNTAGNYQLVCSVFVNSATITGVGTSLISAQLTKNGAVIPGSSVEQDSQVASVTGVFITITSTAIVSLNGSTDYVGCSATSGGTGSTILAGTSGSRTGFYGMWIKQ